MIQRYMTPLDPGKNSFDVVDDGDWVTYTDHAALVARVREAFNRINLQPWKDCACEVCIANGEAWRDLLAALGPETPKA